MALHGHCVFVCPSVGAGPEAGRRILIVDLNNFASFPTLAVGLLRASLRPLDKGASVARNAQFIRDAHEAGLSVRCTMFKGYPGETAEDMAATADFLEAHSAQLDRVRFNEFNLLEDTPIYREMVATNEAVQKLHIRRFDHWAARAQYINPETGDTAYRREEAAAFIDLYMRETGGTQAAALLGEDPAGDDPMWRDRVLTVMNEAVVSSYEAAGVTLVDHHTASDQFMDFHRAEQAAGRRVAAKWDWIVPPQASGGCKVFHLPMEDHHPVPNYYNSRVDDGLELMPFYGDIYRSRGARNADRIRRLLKYWRRLPW